MYCLLNGELKRVEEATLPISDLAVLRGYGIFDFFRVYEGVPLFIDDHLDRFYSSAEQVRLPVGTEREALKSHILDLIAHNQMPVSGIRMVLTGGTGAGAYAIGKPNLIVTQEAIHFPSPRQFESGVKLITHEYLRDIPQVKTINYMTGIWLQDQIAAQGAFDVLYTQNGYVHELTRSNIFIVNANDELVTPNELILHGVTRKQVINAVKDQYPVIQRPLAKQELFSAVEVFLTGTTKKVLPIRQIDGHLFGSPGPITREVMRLFNESEMKFVKEWSKRVF